MKKYLLLFFVFFLMGCKKDAVDATNTRTFQSSINDMTSSLPTLQQVKFNEALYILKTFGVEGQDDFARLKNLGTLLNGKKVPEIMKMADQVAQKNSISWSSTGPPSLGEMDIFGNEGPSETDPNDVQANSLALNIKPISIDSVLGSKALLVVPRLLDRSGNKVAFSGAALETIMEVYSGGAKIFTSKNMMQDNSFRGFTLRFAALPRQKIIGNKIDISVTVKTKDKNFKMSKVGIEVNENALLMPSTPSAETPAEISETPVTNDAAQADPTKPAPASDPKTTVNRFLNNLGSQNLRGAYDTAENPGWGSFEKFSNPTSGFGNVKSLNVKNISTKSNSANAASISATYEVTSKDGKTTTVNATFGLTNVNGEWKISNYSVN